MWGSLYRMQCSSSTASGLVNMYSPSSTSNHNSLVTTPLDMEWSQQGQVGGVAGPTHNHSLNHHGGHLMTLSSGANGHGNGYPASLLSSGFPHNNNYNHITLPRYQNLPQSQSNLPPPVFYPQNHLGAGGAPYSLTTSSSSNNNNPSNFPTNTSRQLQHNNYHPSLGLQTVSRTPNQRIPGSILRVTNTNYGNGPNLSNTTLPPASSFSGVVGPGGTYRPSSEIITTGHPHSLQICTLPRRAASVLSGASSSSSISTNTMATRKPIDQTNLGVGGGEALNASETPGSSVLTPSQLQGSNRSRSNNGPAAVCHSNLQRLTSCLSSSDSQHQALNASAL
ncbi:unnamed protein product [Allacma fusca]|uniref:Uncharacterized protein n=1 Tax=Allacma fusca TaxID=39272 RepID=A0A8J2KZU4_9HEXA|nr:unnamed protein product [Allacma fusca]